MPLLIALVIGGAARQGHLHDISPAAAGPSHRRVTLDRSGSHLNSPAVPDPPSRTCSSLLLAQLGQLHRLLRVLTSRGTGHLYVVGTSVTGYYLAAGCRWPRWSSTRDIIRPGGAVSGKSVKTLLAWKETGSLPMCGSPVLRRTRRRDAVTR